MHVWIAVFALLPVVVAHLKRPEELPLIPCAFHRFTGVPCPFCGFTRAFHAMAVGAWGEAFRGCPAGAVLYLAMLVVIGWHGAATVLGVRIERGPALRFSRRQYWIALSVAGLLFGGNWIYRMVLFGA
mgnify:CR=1 FL=1